MSNFATSAGFGLLVAASLVAGALTAAGLELPSPLAAFVTAFGGGILLSAVALELVPAGGDGAGPWLPPIGLLAGALVYSGADAWLTRDKQMEAMRRSGHAAAVGPCM